MTLAFEQIRCRNNPEVTEKVEAWLEETAVAEIEEVTVHVGAKRWTTYSIFYWEDTDD